jgi:AcrR family transcriptional regulator
MGVKERQERDREAIRGRILDAARELFTSEGYENVSIRKVAEKIEYSPAALYSYFPSKDDLFFALAEQGFRELHQFLRRPRPEDPLEAVRDGFMHYYKFSRTHPEYFELMFVDRSVPRIGRDWQRFAFVNEMLADSVQIVQRAIDTGVFPPETNAEVAFHVLWAATHGPAAIALAERLAPGEDADALARDTIETVINGLRHGTATTFKPAQTHCCPAPEIPENSNVS